MKSKKVISLVMAFVMILTMVACGEEKTENSSDSVSENTSVSAFENTSEGTTEKDSDKTSEVVLDQQGNVIDINSAAIPEFVMVSSKNVPEVADAVCVKVGCPYALVFHEQQLIDEADKSVTPVVIGEETCVPLEFLARVLGVKVDKNSVKEAFDYSGTTMIPLSAVSDIFGKKVFLEEVSGLVIISDNEINFTMENDRDKMVDIMHGFIFERPSREQIAADIQKTAADHPRVIATASDFERIRNLIATDETVKGWYEGLRNLKAEKYVTLAAEGEAKPVYKQDDGGRLADDYEIVDRAISLGLAWQMSGDQKYVDAMWYMLEDICDRTKWEHWHPGHFLNAAQMMAGVAIAYDWMYDGWTDEQRAVIEEALYDCGIEDALTGYYGATNYMHKENYGWRGGWWKYFSNWNPHCNSGVIMAAAALVTHEEYRDLAIKAIDFALQSVELGTRIYDLDGAFDEGLSYWSYATEKLIRLIATLEATTGSSYGLTDAPGVLNTYAEPLHNESKLGIFNYHDVSSVTRSATGLSFWFAKMNEDQGLGAVRYNELVTQEKAPGYMDLLWYDPSYAVGNAELGLDYNFFKTNTASMRSSWTDDYQLYVGLHGCNSVAGGHSHLDAGTFVLDALNTRWFIDLGSDNYNLPQYFYAERGGRWNYYVTRAEGQNTFVINPGTEPDQDYFANTRMTEFVSEPRGAYAKIDLTERYAKDVKEATRGFMMGANRTEVIIQDEITMQGPSEYYWFGHTKAEIEITSDGKSAILSQNGKKLYAKLISDNADLKFSVMDAVSLPTSPVVDTGEQKENSREGIRKLVVHGSGVEEINMAIVLKPFVGDDTPECEYTYVSLEGWSIPEGELIVPKLESISVAGELIDEFNKNVTGYEVVLPADTETIPEIAAVAEAQSECEIILPKQLPGTATIKVVNKEDRSMSSTYSLFMRVSEEVEIKWSDFQEGNPMSHCLDKDLSTRWAVSGEAWGIFTFGRPKKISSVWLAYWKSDARQQIFDIEVSEDGETFTQVWSGKSTATEDVLTEYKIPEGTYKAIKLVFHGTTTGNWNSLLEVEFE